jgi:hypothetical protein
MSLAFFNTAICTASAVRDWLMLVAKLLISEVSMLFSSGYADAANIAPRCVQCGAEIELSERNQ